MLSVLAKYCSIPQEQIENAFKGISISSGLFSIIHFFLNRSLLSKTEGIPIHFDFWGRPDWLVGGWGFAIYPGIMLFTGVTSYIPLLMMNNGGEDGGHIDVNKEEEKEQSKLVLYDCLTTTNLFLCYVQFIAAQVARGTSTGLNQFSVILFILYEIGILGLNYSVFLKK